MREVAVREPAGGLEELVDLALEGAHHDDRGEQREQQEGGEDRADQEAPVGDRVAEAAAVLEDAHGEQGADRVRELAEAAAVLAARDLRVPRLRLDVAALAERG